MVSFVIPFLNQLLQNERKGAFCTGSFRGTVLQMPKEISANISDFYGRIFKWQTTQGALLRHASLHTLRSSHCPHNLSHVHQVTALLCQHS